MSYVVFYLTTCDLALQWHLSEVFATRAQKQRAVPLSLLGASYVLSKPHPVEAVPQSVGDHKLPGRSWCEASLLMNESFLERVIWEARMSLSFEGALQTNSLVTFWSCVYNVVYIINKTGCPLG